MEAVDQIRVTCEQLQDFIKNGSVKVIDACISPNAQAVYNMIAIKGALFFNTS